jgi:hypothetical protein
MYQMREHARQYTSCTNGKAKQTGPDCKCNLRDAMGSPSRRLPWMMSAILHMHRNASCRLHPLLPRSLWTGPLCRRGM